LGWKKSNDEGRPFLRKDTSVKARQLDPFKKQRDQLPFEGDTGWEQKRKFRKKPKQKKTNVRKGPRHSHYTLEATTY